MVVGMVDALIGEYLSMSCSIDVQAIKIDERANRWWYGAAQL